MLRQIQQTDLIGWISRAFAYFCASAKLSMSFLFATTTTESGPEQPTPPLTKATPTQNNIENASLLQSPARLVAPYNLHKPHKEKHNTRTNPAKHLLGL
ncbi:MAG: hypothetical protein H6727_21075 [Myxococcales bacterium]|nr:hypothetical protein [Myxococcales bacterium]